MHQPPFSLPGFVEKTSTKKAQFSALYLVLKSMFTKKSQKNEKRCLQGGVRSL